MSPRGRAPSTWAGLPLGALGSLTAQGPISTFLAMGMLSFPVAARLLGSVLGSCGVFGQKGLVRAGFLGVSWFVLARKRGNTL